MSRRQTELDGRLDQVLSRIAMETQEIKELEQQLTDSQILVNEALQRDLQGIIGSLQLAVRSLTRQVRGAQLKVEALWSENQRLQLHLEDTQRHCRQLEDAARTHAQDMSLQRDQLSLLQMETEALRDRQVESSQRQLELEAELKRLREELALGRCVHKEAKRLREEKKKLQLETRNLRHILWQHRSVMLVCDEVECVEKTLLKRRAELRQADRLLLEAQSCIHTARDKRRAQDGAPCLLEARQQLRELQDEWAELGRRREAELQTQRRRRSPRQEAESYLERTVSMVQQQEALWSRTPRNVMEEQRKLEELQLQTQASDQEVRPRHSASGSRKGAESRLKLSRRELR